MTTIAPIGATIPGVTHHQVRLNSVDLHYVSAGGTGSPIVLVHGWPETWWAFRGLIPLLAETHRVYALDLRGFGDSGTTAVTYDAQAFVDDLDHFVKHLDVGPVHLLSQDISGGVAFRFAAMHPDQVLSFTAIESALAGFGLEALADVNAHGSWHVGFLGAPGMASMLMPGHERDLLEGWAYPLMSATEDALTPSDIDEFVRAYSRADGWRGTEGIYHALFSDNGATRDLAETNPLTMPVLTVDGINHPFTAQSFAPVATGPFTSVHIEGCGHLVAQEAPVALASAILDFTGDLDSK